MTLECKTSQYNYFIKKHDVFYGYNFRTRAVVTISDEKIIKLLSQKITFSKKELLDSSFITNTEFESLKNTGFILEKNFNELAEIQFFYRKNLYDNNTLNLIIAPTLSCNFNCPYCFEDKQFENIRMNTVTQRLLVKWINVLIKGKKNLQIGWYGGEPLLEKRTIKILTKKFQNLCKDNHCKYTSGLTTNGYFIDKNFVKNINKYDLDLIQITFDGNEVFHNKYRCLKNGQPTFEHLYSNILDFIKNKQKCALSIRVNCSDENYDSIFELIKKFPMKVRKNAHIFFKWIYPCKTKNFREFSNERNSSKPYNKLHDLYMYAKETGWAIKNPNNDFFYSHCEVDNLNHYLIGPDGSIYLCSHNMNPKEAIGNLNNKNGIINKNGINKIAKWYAAEPFNDHQCSNCILLPYCMGGCRKVRVEKNQRSCIDEKKSLDQLVEAILKESDFL